MPDNLKGDEDVSVAEVSGLVPGGFGFNMDRDLGHQG
jgi:hypothetical protein